MCDLVNEKGGQRETGPFIGIYIYIDQYEGNETQEKESENYKRKLTFKIKQEVTETQAWTSLTSTLIIIKQNNDSNTQ